MLSNRYDKDMITFTPQGRLLQVEYAMEAVKHGSAAIGLRSRSHVVLVGVNRAPSHLVSSYQKKIVKVGDQIGVAISGLTVDGRSLYRYLQSVSDDPVSRLVVYLANKAQGRTQVTGYRPYGAGLLVGGLDESGTHLYYNCPSGNYIEYQAFAIGSHANAAKTYLESNFENFTDSSREELIKEALIATRETLQGKKLKSSTCTVAVVGVGEPFHILDEETVQQLIDTFDIAEEEDPAAADATEQGVLMLSRRVLLATKAWLQWIFRV